MAASQLIQQLFPPANCNSDNQFMRSSGHLSQMWQSGSGQSGAVSSSASSLPKPELNFVVAHFSENLLLSENGRLLQRKVLFHSRGENIAHLSQPLAVGQQLKLRIVSSSCRSQSSPAFQIGFSLCDLTDTAKLAIHKQTACGQDSVCKRSFAQTVAQFADSGCVVVVERNNTSIDIRVKKGNEERKYVMKFSTGPQVSNSYVSPDRVYYPFVVLSGNADALRIIEKGDSDGCDDDADALVRIPDLPTSHTPPNSGVFRFLITSYENSSIEIRDDRCVVRRTKNAGATIVYLDRKLTDGCCLTLQTGASDGQPPHSLSYEIGVVTCESSSIYRWDYHIREVCDEDRGCGLRSLTLRLSDCSQIGDQITITRSGNSLVLKSGEEEDGTHFRRDIPQLGLHPDPWQPFLILSGDVTAIRIVDQNMQQSDFQLHETAERMIQSLDINPRKASPIQRPQALRNQVSIPLTSSSPPPPQQQAVAKTTKAPPAPKDPVRWASLVTPDARFTQSPFLHLNNNQYRFFQPSHVRHTTVLQAGKSLRLNGEPGVRLAYMSRPWTEDLNVIIKVEKEVPDFRSKSHSFVFGFTTCDKDQVLRHASHWEGFCNSSRPCRGDSYYHSIASNAHPGSYVFFQRKGEIVTITIAGIRGWKIETMRLPLMGQDLWPFVELSGGACEMSIADDIPIPDSSDGLDIRRTTPRFAQSVPRDERFFSSAARDPASQEDEDEDSKEKIAFMTVPYGYSGIWISDDGQMVKRTVRFGPRHVYFNREISIGMSVTFDVMPPSSPARLGLFRFEFGYTSCSKRNILTDTRHKFDICARCDCKGWSQSVGLKYDPDVIKTVTITRQPDMFIIDNGTGADHRRYFKHLPDGTTIHDRWYPFLILNGDVEAVHIADSWIRNPIPRKSFTPPSSAETSPPQQKVQSFPPSVVERVNSPVLKRTQSPGAVTAPVQLVNQNVLSASTATDVSTFERNITSNESSARMVTAKPTAKPFTAKPMTAINAAAAVQTHSSRNVSPSLAAGLKGLSDFPKRKWFGNAVVVFEDPFLRRVDNSATARGYIFSNKLQLNEQIAFKAIRNPGESSPKLVFGVTSCPLLKLEVHNLPPDASLLSGAQFASEWSVYPHLLSLIGVWNELVIKRTESGIFLLLEEIEQLIIRVDGQHVLCPFFQLSGCSVQILPHH